jgi:predicted DNA-binding transcriptional regulator AlpA
MAKLNISQAAQMAGVSRPTIHKKLTPASFRLKKRMAKP